MKPLWYAVEFCLLVAALFARDLSRRDPLHRHVALVLAYGFATDVVRAALKVFVLNPERARLLDLVGGVEALREPFTGWHRAAFHVEQGLLIGWSAALAWVGLRVFANAKGSESPPSPSVVRSPFDPTTPGDPREPKRRGHVKHAADGHAVKVLLVWAVVTVVFAALYPRLSGLPAAPASLARAYGFVTAAGAVSILLAAVGRWRSEPRHLCALLLAAGEGGALTAEFFGPFRSWQPAQVGYVLTFGALCVLQGRWLWKR